MRHWLQRWFLVVLLAGGCLWAGCVGVPQPEPPSLDPVGVTPIPGSRNTTFAYEIAPGSIDPPVGDLWVVGLDGVTDPLLLPVQPDGSVAEFTVASSTIRLQARDGDDRTRPWDFERVADIATQITPANPCFEVALELEVGSAQVGRQVDATLELINGCSTGTNVVATMRRPADVTILSVPTRIEAGSRALVTVRLSPSAVDLREEVLLLTLDSPVPERRAVTLFGFGLP